MARPRIYTKPQYAKTRKTSPVAFSLYPEEKEQLSQVCETTGLTQSDLLRKAIQHPWIFRMTDEQLSTLQGQSIGAALN